MAGSSWEWLSCKQYAAATGQEVIHLCCVQILLAQLPEYWAAAALLSQAPALCPLWGILLQPNSDATGSLGVLGCTSPENVCARGRAVSPP